MVSVSNNSLKLVETNWRIFATFSNDISTPGHIEFPLLSTQGPTVLSLQLPCVEWDARLLSLVRDKVVESGLGVEFLPGSILSRQASTDTLQDILASIQLPSTQAMPVTSNQHGLAILDTFTQSCQEVRQVVTPGQEEVSVSVHSALPAVRTSLGKPAEFSVLAVSGKIASVKCGDQPDTASADLVEHDVITTGDLCLYSDGTIKYRAVVTDISEEHAEAWLLDTGVSVVCDPTELYKMPTELSTHPPAVLSVRVAGEHSLVVGDTTTGTLAVVDSQLVLGV
jgi:hypothetical protein